MIFYFLSTSHLVSSSQIWCPDLIAFLLHHLELGGPTILAVTHLRINNQTLYTRANVGWRAADDNSFIFSRQFINAFDSDNSALDWREISPRHYKGRITANAGTAAEWTKNLKTNVRMVIYWESVSN